MHKAFEQYFKLQGAEFSVEWKSILREIKTITTYDIFGDKWDAQLNLLTSIIEEFGFLPFTNHELDEEIYEDCLWLIVRTKEFTIFIDPEYIEFYGDNLDMKITCVEDLRKFLSNHKNQLN